jgi:bifunctional non-homologous end joining protein LigD
MAKIKDNLIRELKALPKIKQPAFVRPMLATLVNEPFDDPDWLFEIKWDGYRALAHVAKDGVELYSRSQQKFTDKYPEITKALGRIKDQVILDGEIVVLDDKGQSKFQLLQRHAQDKTGRLAYAVFDLLYFNGCDLKSLPLFKRKTILKKLLPASPHLIYSQDVSKTGVKFFQTAVKNDLEGVMAKRSDSPYQAGVRSPHWRKIKTHSRQEAVIAGYTAPRGSRRYLGALVLGVYENSQLVYVGHTGGGFDATGLKEVSQVLSKLKTETSPFATPPKTNAPVTWIKPELVAEVSFQEWTDDGLMRQPIFLGLRHDKKPQDVRRERPQHLSDKTEAAVGRVQLTHQEKIYFPKHKITKGQVVDYYRLVADYLLPHLKDRPQNLRRHPNGIAGPDFYQRDADNFPDWFKTVSIHSDEADKETCYAVSQDLDSLLYLVNLGCIELNPWHVRLDDLDHPDYVVLDLDPEAISFKKVVATAQLIKELLDELKLTGFVKTSGATGIHIYLPTGRQLTAKRARQLAELIARVVAERHPEFTSVERSPQKRQGKVYIDFLQNREHQSLAAVYSLRPQPDATVSTPLAWSELQPDLLPTDFTIKNTLARLKKRGDLWQDL